MLPQSTNSGLVVHHTKGIDVIRFKEIVWCRKEEEGVSICHLKRVLYYAEISFESIATQMKLPFFLELEQYIININCLSEYHFRDRKVYLGDDSFKVSEQEHARLMQLFDR